VRALEGNDKILFLEAGLNDFRMESQMRLAAKLEANMAL
jgi:hypothetical protein